MLTINAGTDRQVIGDIAGHIVRILSLVECGDQAKAEAMITLRTLVAPHPVSVTGCTFSSDGERATKPTRKRRR